MDKTYLKDLKPDEVIRRLQAGEVVRYDNVTATSKLIEGFLCDVFTDGDYRIGSYISARSQPQAYFITPDELKLEVGKCYRTRDGRKAFVSYYVSSINKFVGIIHGENTTRTWGLNGECSTVCMNNDLISEWRDDEEKEND